MNFLGYHVTPETEVKKILDNYHSNKHITTGFSFLSQQKLAKSNGKTPKVPGSLGYGVYTFVEGLTSPDDLIKGFARRQFNGTSIKLVKFSVSLDENQLLDLVDTTSHAYRSFQNYCTALEDMIDDTTLKIGDRGKNQFVWDGVATELIIDLLTKKMDKCILAVRRDTYTPLSEKHNFKRLTSNGYEFLIRSWKIVSDIDHDVLELD